MIDWRPMALAGALSAGCAGNMTPEQKMAHEIFVQVASSCESRYHTIHVDQIDPDGGAQDTRRRRFRARSTVRSSPATARVSRPARRSGARRAQPVYEGLTRTPDVELD